MAERKFQPGLISTIVTFVLFTTLAGLGYWQVERLHWKTELLANINTRMAEKPVPMPEGFDKPSDWQYRRVTLAGNFDFAHEFLVKPRTLDGVAGYDMVVPFTRISGGTVLVDRGWISDALMPKASRPGPGLQKIEGILSTPAKAYFTPDNAPATNDWYWIDVQAMAAKAGLDRVEPIVLNISEKTPGVYPVGGRLHLDIPNDHKQYAEFWFGMAFVLLAVYFLSNCQSTPKLEGKNAGV